MKDCRDLPLFTWRPPTAEIVLMPFRMWRRTIEIHASTIAMFAPRERGRAINKLIRQQLRPRFEAAGFEVAAIERLCAEFREALRLGVAREAERFAVYDDGDTGGAA